MGGVCMKITPQIINLQTELNYLDYACAHANTCMHVHVCMHNLDNSILFADWCHACMHVDTHANHDKHVGGHLQFIYMYIIACFGEHTNLGHPPTYPPTHLPLIQSQGTQICKNAIKLEWIKIIKFCLKIWKVCTFLLEYRLGLMCRWGCPIPKWHF